MLLQVEPRAGLDPRLGNHVVHAHVLNGLHRSFRANQILSLGPRLSRDARKVDYTRA